MPAMHRHAVERILVSPTLAKSRRLCSLLSYVCTMALSGRAREINEQRIGHAVFGRQPDYDSSIDGIVRTQASRLRHKLECYYQAEGAAESVRVRIPRGSYIPQFTVQALRAEPLSEPSRADEAIRELPAAAPQRGESQAMWVLATICMFLLVGLLVLAAYARRERARLQEVYTVESHPLWSELFLPGEATLEVPGDSGLVLFHAFDRRTMPLSEYMAGVFRSWVPYNDHDPTVGAKDLAPDFASRRYTSIVDLQAATKFTQLALSAHSSLQIRYARDVRPNDLKTGNIILFGAAEANPWVELFERNMKFSLHNDYINHVFTVKNSLPLQGEPTEWLSLRDDPEHRVYGLIAYLPNLFGNGKAMVVEGTSMAGCEAALDFLSDEKQLRPFLSSLQRRNG